MRLTPHQQEIAANWLNRVIAGSPLVVVPRWRLEESKHEEVGDGLGRDLDRYKRLVVSLILGLLPYRYRLLFQLAKQGSVRVYRWNKRTT